MPENPIEILKAIIVATAPPNIKIILHDWYTLSHPCQGGCLLTYEVKDVEYRLPGQKLPIDPEEYNLPLFVILLNQPGLGQALHALNDVRKTERGAADEMTDPLCAKAGCHNGANCVLKGFKKK